VSGDLCLKALIWAFKIFKDLYEGLYFDFSLRNGQICEKRLARSNAPANDLLSLLIARPVSFNREQASLVCNQKKTSLKKT